MFAEDFGLAGAVYTDPARVVYRVLGLKHRRADAMTLGALKNTWRAYKSGYRQTSVQGDPWQQGGVFVVDSQGRVKYGYASETTGDHPPLSEILDAVGR